MRRGWARRRDARHVYATRPRGTAVVSCGMSRPHSRRTADQNQSRSRASLWEEAFGLPTEGRGSPGVTPRTLPKAGPKAAPLARTTSLWRDSRHPGRHIVMWIDATSDRCDAAPLAGGGYPAADTPPVAPVVRRSRVPLWVGLCTKTGCPLSGDTGVGYLVRQGVRPVRSYFSLTLLAVTNY